MSPEIGILFTTAAASVGFGVWDLLRNDARDLLRASFLALGGMLIGAGLHFMVPGGFVAGAVAGVAIGSVELSRVVRVRKERREYLLGGVGDDAASLLILHDRLDSLTKSSGGLRWIFPFLAVLALLSVGMVLVVVGFRFDLWLALVVGSLALFLPISLTGRLVLEAGEQRQLGARLAEAESRRLRLKEETRP